MTVFDIVILLVAEISQAKCMVGPTVFIGPHCMLFRKFRTFIEYC